MQTTQVTGRNLNSSSSDCIVVEHANNGTLFGDPKHKTLFEEILEAKAKRGDWRRSNLYDTRLRDETDRCIAQIKAAWEPNPAWQQASILDLVQALRQVTKDKEYALISDIEYATCEYDRLENGMIMAIAELDEQAIESQLRKISDHAESIERAEVEF